MVSTSKSSTLFVQVLFVFTLALLMATCMADRNFHGTVLGDTKVPKQLPVKCNAVHPVQDGETCIAIAQEFKLTAEGLSSLNPNLVCEKLFVGQWICVGSEPAK